jgi:hypothetical protein
MSASIAAIALPVAAIGSFAAKTLSATIGGFGDLLNSNSANASNTKLTVEETEILEDRIANFQKQLASRIRNSGVATDQKVEVHLDEFGLLRAASQGQENTELSRWLSGESDLVWQFSDLQAQVAPGGGAGSLALNVDLATSA